MPRDIRAGNLSKGDTFREYGLDDIHVIADLGYHGDRVLVTTTDGTELSFDHDEVVEIDPEEEEG